MANHSSVLYLPHGGGPLPLLGDQQHAALTKFLASVTHNLPVPEAILVISAHWETDRPNITSSSNPELIYDYYGFPPESYDIEYPANGEPGLATEIAKLLRAANLETELNDKRGFDHGLFVPLKLMYPNANIPCVQLSLTKDLDPATHINMGKALTPLLDKNIMVIGSGMSYHNMRTFFTNNPADNEAAEAFDRWLVETCTDKNLSAEHREQRLIEWEQAPHARFCHPREEHLLPLHVCYGISSSKAETAQLVFDEAVLGKKVCGFLWQSH